MKPTPWIVINAVAQHLGTTRGFILGKDRDRASVYARHLACYLCREMTELSYPYIGRALEMDHTAVIYAREKIAERVKASEDELLRDIQAIRELARTISDRIVIHQTADPAGEARQALTVLREQIAAAQLVAENLERSIILAEHAEHRRAEEEKALADQHAGRLARLRASGSLRYPVQRGEDGR